MTDKELRAASQLLNIWHKVKSFFKSPKYDISLGVALMLCTSWSFWNFIADPISDDVFTDPSTAMLAGFLVAFCGTWFLFGLIGTIVGIYNLGKNVSAQSVPSEEVSDDA